jgi:hypothetical protein
MMTFLQHVPLWVFVVFFILLGIGLMQARTREVSRGRAALLPLAMIALSLSGVAATFATPFVYVAWAVGMLCSVALNQLWRMPRGARYDASHQRFVVPGSWLPLGMMMAIFVARFVVNVSMAMHPSLARDPLFAAGASLLFGMFSGVFFARGLRLWMLAHQPRVVSVAAS